MGYGVRNDKDEVSELMRAAMTAEDAMESKHRPPPAKGNEIVLDEHQQLKKICDERLQEFE